MPQSSVTNLDYVEGQKLERTFPKKSPIQPSATLSLVFHYAIPDTHCQPGRASRRDQAQAKAAAGVINARRAVRKGGVLLGEQTVVT